MVVFAGGDFGGGGDADVAVVPSFIEAGGAGLVDIERLVHGAASPGSWEAVDETILVGVGAEPLPIGVLVVSVGVERGAVLGVDEVASVAGVVVRSAGGGTETTAGGTFCAEARAGSERVAAAVGLIGVIEVA